MGELKLPGKPFEISKRAVWEAWEKVRANKGAPGADGESVADFEKDLKGNLYKIWNRMSSGTYFPPPVRAVEVAKAHGTGTRMLGVPTVADRIAQTVVAGVLEERAERLFHPDSYGYRPKRSALDAVAACRRRCWETDWVIDLDIRKFFDSVPWDLVVKAVQAVTDLPWAVLYVRRWLQAPLRLPDGTLRQRDRGTPQGSSVSPVLANCSRPFTVSMKVTFRMAMWRHGEPRRAGCRAGFGWPGCRGGGQSVVVSSAMAVRAEDSSAMVLPAV